ncbi:hypothetical protein [Flavobacterium sp. UBA7682]|nr:hypothetical protein [Flavobacterium sp. UBA7682]
MEKNSKKEMKHVEVKAGRTIQTPSNALKPKVTPSQGITKKK